MGNERTVQSSCTNGSEGSEWSFSQRVGRLAKKGERERMKNKRREAEEEDRQTSERTRVESSGEGGGGGGGGDRECERGSKIDGLSRPTGATYRQAAR